VHRLASISFVLFVCFAPFAFQASISGLQLVSTSASRYIDLKAASI
jgi:hypothetical protein